jgi:hypothetical protein
MQFHCASCGLEIVSRYDGRLAMQPGKVPVVWLTCWMIHRWCARNWEQEYGEAWAYSDLKRVVEAEAPQGGR